MNIEETQKKINDYCSEKIEACGATSKGVDYNGPEAQERRLEQLAKVINFSQPFTILVRKDV